MSGSSSSSAEDLAAFQSVAVDGGDITSSAAQAAAKAAGATKPGREAGGPHGTGPHGNGHAGDYSLDEQDAPLPQGFRDKLWSALTSKLDQSLKTNCKLRKRTAWQAEHGDATTDADMDLRLFQKVKAGTPVSLTAPAVAPKPKRRKTSKGPAAHADAAAKRVDEDAEAMERAQSVAVDAAELMQQAAAAAAKAAPHIVIPDRTETEEDLPKRKTRIYIPQSESAPAGGRKAKRKKPKPDAAVSRGRTQHAALAAPAELDASLPGKAGSTAAEDDGRKGDAGHAATGAGSEVMQPPGLNGRAITGDAAAAMGFYAAHDLPAQQVPSTKDMAAKRAKRAAAKKARRQRLRQQSLTEQ